MRSLYRRRASPSPSPAALASTARRTPRGTSPVPRFPLSPGVDSVTAGRAPPVRPRHASLAPLPYVARPPIPCTSRSPQRLRHRRRRQASLLHGAPAGKPRAHVDFSEPSPGTAKAHSGMLPEYSPGTRDGTRHCTPCSSTSPGVPRRPSASRSTPLCERSREYGARTSPRSSPIPCWMVRSPPVRRSGSVTGTGSPSCPGRAPCSPRP